MQEQLKNMSPAQQQALMQRMASQVEQAQLQDIVAVTSDMCVKKCLGVSGNQVRREKERERVGVGRWLIAAWAKKKKKTTLEEVVGLLCTVLSVRWIERVLRPTWSLPSRAAHFSHSSLFGRTV